MNQASRLTGNDSLRDRLRELRGIANDLRGNYYERKRFLDAEAIGRDLERMAELVDLLAPLTAASP